MGAASDWRCEYGFVRDYWTNGEQRQCLRPWASEVFGTRVCSSHRDAIASPVILCGQCGRYAAHYRWNFRETVCFSCIERYWPNARRFNRCRICQRPVDDRHYNHCGDPVCKAVAEYFGRNRRVGWYRFGELYHLAQLTEFLRRMAQPNDDLAREFAKRYAHRRL